MKTVSLELAKQLKEAGFPQESYFYWVLEDHIGEKYILVSKWDIIEAEQKRDYNKSVVWMQNYLAWPEKKFAAPTAEEILDLLPAMIESEGEKYYLIIEKLPHSNHFEITYMTEGEYASTYDNGDCRQKGDSLAEAVAVFEEGRINMSTLFETVIVAAIKLQDGTIIRGQRHADCIRIACGRMRIKKEKLVGRTEGFITSRNRFVDRKEGYKIQIEAGIPSANKTNSAYFGKELDSEDLY